MCSSGEGRTAGVSRLTPAVRRHHRVSKGEEIMQARPRTKARRKSRYRRCPKCQKQVRLHQVRCRTCHQKLKLK
jgi:hypothetical protein